MSRKKLDKILNSEGCREKLSVAVDKEVSKLKEEAPISVSREPDLKLAKELLGSPQVFGKELLDDLQVLQEQGIAADFGEEGWARGHRWREFVRKG